MSKLVSSLLCDFVVPVVGGSLFEALSATATLCGEMKENEAMCRRVYERLRFVYDELQRCSDASSLRESRVLAMYGSAIAQFLGFLESHSRKRLLRRLIESARVTDRIQEFHKEIDELFKVLSIVHMTEMSAWRHEWEQDRTMRRNMVQEAQTEDRCGAHSPCSSLATLSISTCSPTSCVKGDVRALLSVPAGGNNLMRETYTDQGVATGEKELEEAIRDYIGEVGYDVCSVLDLLRSLPSAGLALRGAAVLHDLEIELQPEVLCLALPCFIQELTCLLSETKDSYARELAERYWLEWFPAYVRTLVQGHGLVIENAANLEILFAPGSGFKLDSAWRRVVTWCGAGDERAPSEDELETQWRLVPVNETKTLFRVVNFRYPYEWLHATSVGSTDGNGMAHAMMSQPPHGSDNDIGSAPEALWELQPLRDTAGSFLIYNPHTGVYLCSAKKQLDPDRRLALVVPETSASEPSTMRRCAWRLRPCFDPSASDPAEEGRNSVSASSPESNPRLIPEAAREFAALELVIRNLFNSTGSDIGAVVEFLRKLPEPKHTLFGCSIARSLDHEVSKTAASRRDSLVLPFFVYELATTLPVGSRELAQQYWCHWFSPVQQSIVLGRGVLLENKAGEYLVSPEVKLGADERRQRPVATYAGDSPRRIRIGGRAVSREWIPGTDDLEAQWRFEPANLSRTQYRIVNYRYPYEEMRARGAHHSSVDDSWGSRNFVVTTRASKKHGTPRSPAHSVGNNNKDGSTEDDSLSLWELHEVGHDCYQLVHLQEKTVLCASTEKLDKHRRFVTLQRFDKDQEQLSQWRFQTPLGLA